MTCSIRLRAAIEPDASTQNSTRLDSWPSRLAMRRSSARNSKPAVRTPPRPLVRGSGADRLDEVEPAVPLALPLGADPAPVVVTARLRLPGLALAGAADGRSGGRGRGRPADVIRGGTDGSPDV